MPCSMSHFLNRGNIIPFFRQAYIADTIFFDNQLYLTVLGSYKYYRPS